MLRLLEHSLPVRQEAVRDAPPGDPVSGVDEPEGRVGPPGGLQPPAALAAARLPLEVAVHHGPAVPLGAEDDAVGLVELEVPCHPRPEAAGGGRVEDVGAVGEDDDRVVGEVAEVRAKGGDLSALRVALVEIAGATVIEAAGGKF